MLTLSTWRIAPDSNYWCIAKDGDAEARSLFDRHYSRRRYRDGRRPKKFIGPGEYLLLITPDNSAVIAWRKFISDDGQQGVNCAIFRYERPPGGPLASDLLRDAMGLAWRRWPHARLYTYVNPKAIKSTNPGCCFRKAGWQPVGHSKRGLLILATTEAS